MNVQWQESVEQTRPLFVSKEFYPTLGKSVALGRALDAQDEEGNGPCLLCEQADTILRKT